MRTKAGALSNVWRSLLKWQCELENGAMRLCRRRPKAPVVTFDNSAANGKPEADTSVFCCEEWLKDALGLLWFDPHSRVFNGDQDVASLLRPGTNFQLP